MEATVVDLKALWQRPESRFLILFVSILTVSFTVIALKPVNDSFVNPYTTLVAHMSAGVLRVLGEDAVVRVANNSIVLASSRFSVTIYNGCNGLITSLIFISGVLAFPAAWRAKAVGAVGGLAAIQAINLVRIVSLFYIGIFLPQFFNESHIFVWQSLVIIAGVALWIVWAHNAAAPLRSET
jgi:exosortase H (IPTLxxWG-CTERM-specific)